MSKKRKLEAPEEHEIKRARLVKHELLDLPWNPLCHIYTFLDAREHYRMGLVRRSSRGQWNDSKYHHEGGVWDPRAWAPNLKAEQWMNAAGLWRIGCQRIRELDTQDLHYEQTKDVQQQFRKTVTSLKSHCWWSPVLEGAPLLQRLVIMEAQRTQKALQGIFALPLVALRLDIAHVAEVVRDFPGHVCCRTTLTDLDIRVHSFNPLGLSPMDNLLKLRLRQIAYLSQPLSRKMTPKLQELSIVQERVFPIFDQELALQLRRLWVTTHDNEANQWNDIAPGVTQMPELELYASDDCIPPFTMPKLRALWVAGTPSQEQLPQLANRVEFGSDKNFWDQAMATPLPDVPTVFVPPPNICSECKLLSVNCLCSGGSGSEDDDEDECLDCGSNINYCDC